MQACACKRVHASVCMQACACVCARVRAWPTRVSPAHLGCAVHMRADSLSQRQHKATCLYRTWPFHALFEQALLRINSNQSSARPGPALKPTPTRLRPHPSARTLRGMHRLASRLSASIERVFENDASAQARLWPTRPRRPRLRLRRQPAAHAGLSFRAGRCCAPCDALVAHCRQR
jgi:hypothetical protein